MRFRRLIGVIQFGETEKNGKRRLRNDVLTRIEMKQDTNTIFRTASLIMLCTIVIKLLGFLRQFVLSYFWGTSSVSDAYLISQTIPGTIFEFAGTGIATCYIPLFYKILKEHGKSAADIFTNKIASIILSFSTLVIIGVWVDTPLFVRVFATGFEGNTLELACTFTRISVLSLYFSTLTGVFRSLLEANKKFLPNAISEVIQSLFVLLSIYLAAKYNVWILCIGTALSIGIRVLIMYPYTRKLGFNFKLDFKWKDSYVSTFISLLLPVIIGVTVNDLNTIFDRTIASTVAVGAISALTYGYSLLQLAVGGIVLPIVTVYYPNISEFISDGCVSESKRMLRQTSGVLLYILIPLTALFITYSTDITMILFGRGAFDADSIEMTSEAFSFYSVGLCFIAIREVLTRYYYASKNTKTPMINATIGVLFNILFNLALSKVMGIGGLALATSISAIVTAVLLIIQIKSKLDIKVCEFLDFRAVIKCVFVVVAISIFSRMVFGSIISTFYNLALLVISFFLSYLAITYIIGVEDSKTVIGYIRERLHL